MIPTFDSKAFGEYTPNLFDRSLVELTRRCPNNWLGLRAAMLLRRMSMRKGEDRPFDISLWSINLRLYPRRNGCEKNALFTPQMFDVAERAFLAQKIDEKTRWGQGFVFIDIGANVGLYSLFVAARGGQYARVIAVEPQPGIIDRLKYNVRINPGLNIEFVEAAVADYNGEMNLMIDSRDAGGTRLSKSDNSDVDGYKVPVRTIAAILTEHGISQIDFLKVDIEGAEDIALGLFLADAPASILPRALLIEDSRNDWSVDIFSLLMGRGYSIEARSKQNVMLRLDPDGTDVAPACGTR